jgi:hemolysin activation/secretion protein
MDAMIRNGEALGRRFALLALKAAPAAIAASLAAQGSAYAQSAGSREQVLRVPAPLRAAASDFGVAQCPTTSLVPAVKGEVVAARFGAMRLEGVTVVDQTSLAMELDGFTGKPVSREGLARLAARIECRYRERGFVFARAAISADTGEGQFSLTIQEGRLQSLEVSTEQESLARLLLRAFSGVKVGAPLNAADVRESLAKAASIGITDVRPTVRRSRTDPNAIDLVLVAASPANQLIGVTQNANDDSLGPWGGLAAVHVHGLTPLQERSTFGVYTSSDGREQLAVQASSEALVSNSGLTARIEGAFAKAKPGGALSPLDIVGEATFLSAEILQPFIVRRGLIASWRLGLESVDQITDLFGTTALNKDSLRIAIVGARADGVLGGNLWSGSLEARHGIEGLGANRPGDRNLSRLDGDPQALAVRASVEANRKVTSNIALRATARGQWSDTSLLAFEEFNFGALSGGRGFDPGAITGDRGIALGFEASYAPIALPAKLSAQPFAFLEGAEAENVGLGARRANGGSAGLGLRVEWAQKLRLDVHFAEPFEAPRNVGRGRFGSKVGVQISTALDWSFKNGFGRKAAS